MFEIRPHHLLCMRAYIGNGYSEEFKIKMEEVIKELKVKNEFLKVDNMNNEKKEVKVVFSTDSLCEKCPNKLGYNKCTSQDKVNLLDLKMIKYFNLNEGIFNYKDLQDKVYNKINEEIFDDICKECEWYNKTNCKEYIIKSTVRFK